MKIGRNDPCYCKSEKKYKNCHERIDKEENENKSKIARFLKECEIKHCLYPKKEKCSNNIVKAHSIQNNRILCRLDNDGHIYMIKRAAFNSEAKSSFKLVGRRKATTFTGFCALHDKKIFQPIEDTEYIGSAEQDFLFSYRILSFEYHTKLQALRGLASTFGRERQLLNISHNSAALKGHLLGTKCLFSHQSVFDNALVSKDYSSIEMVKFELDESIKFAVSSGFFLEYDLNGNIVNRLGSENMKLLMMTIFPQDNKSYIIFSWLKEHSSVYNKFKEQLCSLDVDELKQCLNNLIPLYCENAVYNPVLINSWSEDERVSYIEVFDEFLEYMYGKIPKEEGKLNLLRETPYNLFK